MSLYGHSHISHDSLKRWAEGLSLDGVTEVEVGGKIIELNKEIKGLLMDQTKAFSELINELKESDDWRQCQGIFNSLFYNAFARLDHKSIRVGDFYECIIVPSNVKTYKKILKGFQNREIGTIQIHDKHGNDIASIGEKSDLIWSVFFHYFINENEDGTIDYTYADHEEYLSIQLFNVENLSLNELEARVNEILVRVSMEYDMEFKPYELDARMTIEGNCPVISMEYTPTGFEQIPMLYLANAINSDDERLSYLSFYHVIEYFFVRAQNNFFLNEFQKIDIQNVDHNELRKVLGSYKNVSNEREALRLVLNGAIDIPKFKAWINSSADKLTKYCNCEENPIDISKEDKKVISALVNRVYSYRCSIAHAKGDVEEFIAVPSFSKDKIANELPLIKYLAFETISYWSNN